MNWQSSKWQRGVTLVEVMLVMVVISAFIVMGVNYVQQRTTNLRLERTALQMQQILNAGMAYYVSNGSWPNGMETLVTAGYFASDPTSPWGGQSYSVGTNNANFYVWTEITLAQAGLAGSYSRIISGQLPFGYISDDNGTPGTDTSAGVPPVEADCAGTVCHPISYVTIPGQSLNNAGAVNFAGLYHHGACVPVPKCGVDANGSVMVASVFIVPISVSGVNDAGSGSTAVYPISSFTGYAVGGDSATPGGCEDSTTQPDCTTNLNGPAPQSGNYWRACLDLITERGSVGGTGTGTDAWGQYVTLMALTRCGSVNEAAGSSFTVYSN